MFFAPVIRRTAYATRPAAPADFALQRFLQSTLASQGTAVAQDEKTVTLQIDVPGLAREQLNITIEGQQVRLSSVEGAPRQVNRAWELADEIDVAGSSAKLENGVLTLVLAKVVPQSRATQLSIG
ncbi:Hsp20/alpha crystallin family protein [Paracidovorax konjaci]|uniref:CS domain-containing protein n=1 Tax=Paracidovorax konjaci TaxID=32040 RepID=A0A1I1Y4V1_9BURK|nr:Hsp20/alpha crystallin family protein [Paracidovorax konjaci]SFE13113.1 CS domain-containing protein [Paracidovorax konjaci]